MNRFFVLVGVVIFFTAVAATSPQTKSTDGNPSSFRNGFGTALGLIIGLTVAMTMENNQFAQLSYGVQRDVTLNQTVQYLRQSLQTTYFYNKRIKSYDTGRCILGDYRTRGVTDMECDSDNSHFFESRWSINQPVGYPYNMWFQISTTVDHPIPVCLQAGSRTGYGAASNGDRAILVPCNGHEPTQIFTFGSYWNGYYQFKDLGSGKCLDWDRYNQVMVMWECKYASNNQWWGVMDNNGNEPNVE